MSHVFAACCSADDVCIPLTGPRHTIEAHNPGAILTLNGSIQSCVCGAGNTTQEMHLAPVSPHIGHVQLSRSGVEGV